MTPFLAVPLVPLFSEVFFLSQHETWMRRLMKIGAPCDHLGTCEKRQRVEKDKEEEEEEDVNEKVEEEEGLMGNMKISK